MHDVGDEKGDPTALVIPYGTLRVQCTGRWIETLERTGRTTELDGIDLTDPGTLLVSVRLRLTSSPPRSPIHEMALIFMASPSATTW